MDDFKEMAGSYEIMQRCRFGGKELLIGHDSQNAGQEYMTCYRRIGFFGEEELCDAVGSKDFLEVMKIYQERLGERIEAVEAQRSQRQLPFQAMGQEHCQSGGENDYFEGKVVVISPESLAPEYRSADHQLGIAISGFGCSPNTRGRAVYVEDLYTGKESRWDRSDILGVASLDKLPVWAQKKLAEREKQRPEKKKMQGGQAR